MSENDVDKIDADDFDHNKNAVFLNQVTAPNAEKPSLWAWIGLSGLLLLALLIIFVLPSIVSQYELPFAKRADPVQAPVADTTANALNAVSPFAEAQRSLQRQEAQDVLGELLANQAELKALEVSRWGQEDYAIALQQGHSGGEYYRTQDFVPALESYQTGRDGMRALLDSSPTVLAQILIEGEQALAALDSAAAQDRFSLALVLDPENQAAQIGTQRAQTLDEVSALLSSAEDSVEEGELQQALADYNEVLNLDSYNEIAANKAAEVAQLITNKEFAEIMSSGYALLQNGAPEQAIAAFQRALRLGIRHEQALAAITQTENEIANAEINRIGALISTAEQGEQWQEAVNQYDNVLTIDSNLLFAIEGRDYAEKRARLDRLLQQAIANPERFAEESVFEQTLDVYYTGRAIQPPGSRLLAQLDELQGFLENSQIPVEIQFRSDGLTDVTLLRIESLGIFQQTSLSLKPGRYVAVGKRSGFREVREEFTVGFGLTPDSVLVQCIERIVSASRR